MTSSKKIELEFKTFKASLDAIDEEFIDTDNEEDQPTSLNDLIHEDYSVWQTFIIEARHLILNCLHTKPVESVPPVNWTVISL